MRLLKIVVLVTLLAMIILAGSLAWLVRSEQGSRWLLERGLEFVPITIEVDGVSGTLRDGFKVEYLYIEFPVAELRARDISLGWHPAGLLAGKLDVDRAYIRELSVDVIQSDSPGDPIEDGLFWLRFPLDIDIESGRLDRLRVEAAVFEVVEVAGVIGRGRLEIGQVSGQVAGINIQAAGVLAGPAPGHIEAMGRWKLPAAEMSGAGRFTGDIEGLAFTHLINVPEALYFNGEISDLFKAPSLAGVAEWQSIRVPGGAALFSEAGRLSVSSDFLSARVEGTSIVSLDGWPDAPLQLEAHIDPEVVTFDSFVLDALRGQVTGAGRIEFRDRLRGRILINGSGVDTGLIRDDLPGRLGFDAALTIESLDAFAIDVTAADAQIAGNELTGFGRAHWRDDEWTDIDFEIAAGVNTLAASIGLGAQLTGTIDANAPELATLWPGLQGALDASLGLAGSVEQPQFELEATAVALSLGTQSLDALSLSAELREDDSIAARLVATKLVSGEQEFGALDVSIAGTLAEHRSQLKLAGGLADIELRTIGGWDGEQFIQRFEFGRLRPDGFPEWRLQKEPELRVSPAGGQVETHCWKQAAASLCVDASRWDAEGLRAAVAVDGFELATLQPLLAEGYRIDGSIDADLSIERDPEGLQAGLRWRQSRTVLAYADEIDAFQAVIEDVRIDLVSDDTETTLAARLTGEQGLSMTAQARVDGPLAEASPLQASADGRVPHIGLLRPLVRRVVNPGELQGELRIDLDAGGTLGDPVFTGGAYLVDGLLGLPDVGVTLSEINVAAESKGGDKLLVSGQFRSGDGIAEVNGEVRAVEELRLLADIRIQGKDLAVVRVPDLSVDASPELRLLIGDGGFDITGTLAIPRASARIRALPKSAVARSTDVVVHRPDIAQEEQSETIVTGNVEVILGDDVRFNGFGLDSRLEGGLKLTQARRGFLRSAGTVRVREGFLTGYGKELRVDRGELTFTGPLDDPLINIQVSRESIYEGRQYTVGLRLTGSAQNVKTEAFSRPAMSEQDVLAFLLFDRPASSGDDASGAALALGLQQIVPGDNGILGLDEVSFETNDASQAAMVAGKRINDKLFVRYVFGSLGEPGAFRIRYRLTRGFSLEASTGARQSLDLIYVLERE